MYVNNFHITQTWLIDAGSKNKIAISVTKKEKKI